MAHEITIREDGSAEAFYADNPAWHKLGIVVEGAKTSEEAIVLAKMDWNVLQAPVVGAFESSYSKPSKQYFTNVREDTKEILGVVKSRYNVVQNKDAFTFIDSLINEGQMVYESAGTLKGGKLIWLLARSPKTFILGEKDVIKDYILCVTSHDGTKQMTILPTKTRVVCWNTLVAALEGKVQGKYISIRHTAGYTGKLEEARKVLGLLEKYNSNMNNYIEHFANTAVNMDDVTKFLQKTMPMPKEEKESARVKNVWNAITQNFTFGVNQQLNGSKDTAWGMLNAFTEYVDHQRNTRKENSEIVRIESALFGSGAEMKRKAFSSLAQMYQLEKV